MFPPNHGRNSSPHAYYAEQCLLGDQTFCRSDPTSSFLRFSPFLNHNSRFPYYDYDLLSGQLTQSLHPYSTAADVGANNAMASKKVLTEDVAVLGTTQKAFSGKNSPVEGGSRKRSSNRERHSKIFTSQGLRDRRMRLSVDVARKFFGLQDMLGFDKASKTISWLLTKSKEAINELGGVISQTEGCGGDSSRGVNSASESEDTSGLDENTGVVEQQERDLKQKSLEAAPKSKETQDTQKAAACSVAKKSRALARAKARERAKEKVSKRLDKSKQLHKGSPIDPDQFRPLGPLGSAKDSGSCIIHDNKPIKLGAEISETNKFGPSIHEYDQHFMNCQGENTGDLASFNNNGMITFIPENWDMGTTRMRSSCCNILNMHPFTGF